MSTAAAPWEQLFQRAPSGYLTTDDDGVVQLVNETFLRWSGLRREDVVGVPLTRHLPVGDRILYTTHCVPRLAMDGAVDEIALELVGGDGVRRAALLSAVREPAGNGAPAVVRVVVFGAHERRRFERDLLASRLRAEESEARRAVAESELQHRVLHDPLTGLRNRTGLLADLAGLLAHPAPGLPVTLLFLDLDNFKVVNDSLGHAAGDEILVRVARRLQAEAPDGAVLARLAGDEFVVVDRTTGSAAAGALAERLLAAVALPVSLEGLELVLTASSGIALAEQRGDTPEALVRRADIAMYRSKTRGRGGWEVQHPDDEDPAAGRLQLVGDLRRGILADELEVHYQPRVDLRSGALSGVEALVRWRHPGRGLLDPEHFIALAESSGLVRELGVAVVDVAVAQTAAWRTASGAGPGLGVGVSVNLSARQLGDPRLVAIVRAALDRHGLPPEALTLEITETALVADPEGARLTLAALAGLGVKVSVDDFGTGYASLTYLKDYPVDELKIDRLFVSGLDTDRADRAIVAACIQLGHAVGSSVVAEGVETDAQRQALVDLGCDVAQGFLYSRPVPADELTAWSVDFAARPGLGAAAT